MLLGAARLLCRRRASKSAWAKPATDEGTAGFRSPSLSADRRWSALGFAGLRALSCQACTQEGQPSLQALCQQDPFSLWTWQT